MEIEKIPGGFILLARKTLNNGIMKSPPLHLKLWVWMLLQASWKDHGDLKKGQFFTSIDKMRDAMAYHVGNRLERPTKKQIRCAYESLRKGTRIGIAKVTHGMIITILNYDHYQDWRSYEGHTEGHAEKSSKGTILRKKGIKKEKHSDAAARVLSLINEIASKKFKCVDRNLKPISARIDEYSEADCITVVRGAWQDPNFNKTYFQPSTLFRPTNFENYINRYRHRAIPQADDWKEAH